MGALQYSVCILLCLYGMAGVSHGADKPPIEYMSSGQAQQKITQETIQPYFSLLQPREMVAKTGQPLATDNLPQQRLETRRRYAAAVLDFSPEEKQALAWYLAEIIPVLQQYYPKLAATPWRFIKVNNTIEGGLPHTREDFIVLSQAMLDFFVSSYAGMSRAERMERAGVILLHEIVHVYQRQHPTAFDSLYTGWGFVKAAQLDLSGEWFTRRQIINPDAIYSNWIIKLEAEGQHWFLPYLILESTQAVPAMPEEFRMLGIRLQSNAKGYQPVYTVAGEPDYFYLGQSQAYRARFAGASSLYHPHEIAADYFSRLVVLDHFIERSALSQEQRTALERVFAPSRDWFRKNL